MAARSDNNAAAARPTVRELQELAQSAVLRPRKPRTGPSRAARLQLIDILSRWGGSGLALLAGVTIFTAIFVGGAYPLRALLWATTVLAALAVARRLLKGFRTGARHAARPFRWRAEYTAAVSVLSAAVGSSAVIALPAGAPPSMIFETFALILAASLGAGIAHTAHGRTAIAASLPAALFVFWGAWRLVGPQTAFWGVGSAIITGAFTLFFFHYFLRQRAVRRFPRTTYARREVTAKDSAGSGGGTAKSSAKAS